MRSEGCCPAGSYYFSGLPIMSSMMPCDANDVLVMLVMLLMMMQETDEYGWPRTLRKDNIQNAYLLFYER